MRKFGRRRWKVTEAEEEGRSADILVMKPIPEPTQEAIERSQRLSDRLEVELQWSYQRDEDLKKARRKTAVFVAVLAVMAAVSITAAVKCYGASANITEPVGTVQADGVH